MRPEFEKKLKLLHKDIKRGEKRKGFIAELQKEKLGVMSDLKERMRLIEQGEAVVPDAKHIWQVRYDDGKYIAGDESGNEVEMTLGDIMTDGIWGLGYVLDPETVPRMVRKEYMAELAKNKLLELLDKQILFNEVQERTPYSESSAALLDRLEGKKDQLEMDSGHIAEAFAANYLKKMSFAGILPIEVEDVDAYEDVVDKTDFIVKIKDHVRAAYVESNLKRDQDIAVQFTTKVRKNRVLRKRKIMEDALFERGG